MTRAATHGRIIARAAVVVTASVALIVVGQAAQVARAGPVSVTLYAATAPSGAGDCTDIADACTLDTALAAIPPGGTVRLVTGGDVGRYVGNWTINTVGTSSANPVNVTASAGLGAPPILDGNGAAATLGTTCSTSSCNGPILTIPVGVTAVLSGLTMTNADNTTSGGGALRNLGATTVTGSTFTANLAKSQQSFPSGFGGGIYSTGTLHVSDSTFANNLMSPGGIGGAIYVGAGTATVSGSSFTGNTAYSGGAIGNGSFAPGGSVSVDNSTFTQNHVRNDGGAIDNADSSGTGTLVVTDSTFDGNSAETDGGAISHADGTQGPSASVLHSTFVGNHADYQGGAIEFNDFTNGPGATIDVAGSTFASNTAGSGGPSLVVGFFGHGGTATLAGNVFATSCKFAGGTTVDRGDNVGVDSTCMNAGAGDLNAGPSFSGMVGPLSDNGGPTKTALLVGPANPAVGVVPAGTSVTMSSGPLTLCPTTDQRGVTTPNGQACAAGATQPPVLSVTGATTSTQFGQPLPPLGPGYDGFVAGQHAADLGTPATCSVVNGNYDGQGRLLVGTYDVGCSGATNSASTGYAFFYANGSIQVDRGDQGLALLSAPPSPAIYGDGYTQTVTAGASGNPVVFALDTSSDPGVCAVDSSGVVGFTGVGTCAIRVTQDGDTNWLPASALQSFSVGPATVHVDAVPVVKGVSQPDPPATATLRGTDFRNGDTAATSSIGGSPACQIVGAHSAAGAYPGAVQCDAGTLTAPHYTFVAGSSADLTVLPRPIITHLSASSGPTTGGTNVVITGTGFTGTTKVVFGAVRATTYSVVSDTEIDAVTPPHAAGGISVRVKTVGRISAKNRAARYTYVVPVSGAAGAFGVRWR